MKGNYNAVASFYDRLAHLIFGKAIEQAQRFLLKAIPANSKVLIIGGGTGWILEALTQLYPTGLLVTYVEISEKMMRLSKKRKTGENKILFINAPIQEAALDEIYDVVLTAFLFDNFSNPTAQAVFEKVHHHLKQKGLWLFTDFQIIENTTWQKVFLKSMYLFFGLLCNLDTNKLPDVALLFQQYQYKAVTTKNFYGGFIGSVTYQKQ